MIITSFQRIFTDASKNKSWSPKHFALVDEGLLSVSISTVFSLILAIEKVFQSRLCQKLQRQTNIVLLALLISHM